MRLALSGSQDTLIEKKTIEGILEKYWWGHLNNKRSTQGGNKALQPKQKCKDSIIHMKYLTC